MRIVLLATWLQELDRPHHQEILAYCHWLSLNDLLEFAEMISSFNPLREEVPRRNDLRHRLVERILARLDSLRHLQINRTSEISEELDELLRSLPFARLSDASPSAKYLASSSGMLNGHGRDWWRLSLRGSGPPQHGAQHHDPEQEHADVDALPQPDPRCRQIRLQARSFQER
jgi:hypothetical protein